ncbi:7-cyano-7-deazaguanine synthase [Ekhidna sp.]|uniref:7-cyano-7-deazaguanine synthase n=1 Tax=Ekhidna sp. TaxID=2608089 RepID=UPI0032995FF5
MSINILFSGGIDSAACINFYLNQSLDVKTTYIDFGQKSRDIEIKAAKAITNYYKVPLSIVKCEGIDSKSSGLIEGRNLFLISAALMLAKHSDFIAIGIHKGTKYPDCSEEFVKRANSVISIYFDSSVKLLAPFVSWSKNEIWDYCNLVKVPLDLTYSCELGLKQPCGKCESCADLKVFKYAK